MVIKQGLISYSSLFLLCLKWNFSCEKSVLYPATFCNRSKNRSIKHVMYDRSLILLNYYTHLLECTFEILDFYKNILDTANRANNISMFKMSTLLGIFLFTISYKQTNKQTNNLLSVCSEV